MLLGPGSAARVEAMKGELRPLSVKGVIVAAADCVRKLRRESFFMLNDFTMTQKSGGQSYSKDGARESEKLMRLW